MKHTAYRIFKKPFFGRFVKPWLWPENADQNQWKALHIPSQTGSTLSALIAHAHTSKVKGAILLAHPMGTIAKGFWMKYGHAELLRQAGYHVMVFDLNGFGESPSTTLDYPLDVLAAGQSLQAHFPDLPIAVLGSSMGAGMSACALAQPDHPFKVAILESAFPTLLHFWSRYPVPKLGVQLAQSLYPAGERRLRPIHAAEHLIGQPSILLIYSDADEFTPLEQGKLLWQAFKHKTKTEFWQVSGAKHTHAYAAQPDAYAQRVITFLDENLVSM